MNNPVITVTDVTKAVGNRRLLEAVSFTIAPQSLVSLIGPNGAGKSTMVKIILGLDHQYSGSVTIKAGERVQYIPQLLIDDQYQLPMSVHEYISIAANQFYSLKQKDVDFTEALTHVGVEPDKLYQPYTSLSGGERQRVAIARALLSNPTILVLDEPLAAVDYASRSGLYELIRHLQKDHQMTVLLVSHDIDSVLPLSDQVLCLNQTLHTDCHPLDFTANPTATNQTIHHHC